MSKVKQGGFYWVRLYNAKGEAALAPCIAGNWNGRWYLPYVREDGTNIYNSGDVSRIELLNEEAIPLPANWENKNGVE